MATKGRIMWNLRGLRIRYKPETRYFGGLIAAAPWLNAGLIVVMFLWLTFPYVLQPGLIVQLPETPFAAGTPYGLRLAVISQESQEPGGRDEIVYFDDEPFLVRDKGRMEALGQALARAARERPQTPLIIEADRRILHGTVVALFNMAADAGIREINIATRAVR